MIYWESGSVAYRALLTGESEPLATGIITDSQLPILTRKRVVNFISETSPGGVHKVTRKRLEPKEESASGQIL